MSSDQLRDEVFWMFKRSVVPKLEITIHPRPQKIGCIVTPGSQFVLEAVDILAKQWNSEIFVYHRVKYIRDLMSILNRAFTEEKLLISSVNEFFENTDLTITLQSMTVPPLDEVRQEIENFLKRKKKFIIELLTHAQEQHVELLVVPIPMFKLEHAEDAAEETLGSELENLLRNAPKSLPLLLVPSETKGKEHVVVVFFEPRHMTALAERLTQFCSKDSHVILVSLIDTKLIELYQMMHAETTEPGTSKGEETTPTSEAVDAKSVEETLKERMRELADRVVATVRPHVKSIELEIISGSLVAGIRSIVEKHEAMYLMIFTHASPEEALDSETEMLSRLVKNTKIFIFKD